MPGNVLNRVYDSSGPEGKVRGNPQQIIEKYLALARDAALVGDRVAAENFAQHSEHYTRILGAAQREMEAKRVQQDAQAAARRAEAEARAAANAEARAAAESRMHSLTVNDSRGSGLVDTPEGDGSGKRRAENLRAIKDRNGRTGRTVGQSAPG